jgi:hypothetical protein
VRAVRDEYHEDAVAARDGPLDDGAIVGRPGHDRDPVFEGGEFGDALLPAHRDDLVSAFEYLEPSAENARRLVERGPRVP